MKDERTKKLMELMTDDFDNHNPEDIIQWNYNKIKEFELNELDSYRIFRMFSDMKRGDVSSYISDLLDSKSKLFVMKDSVKHLLSLTKPSKIKEELKLPFNELFVDFDYMDDKKDFRIFGLNIMFADKKEMKKMVKKLEEATGRELPSNYKQNKIVVSTYVFFKEINDWMVYDFNIDLTTMKVIPKLQVKETYEKMMKETPIYFKNYDHIGKILSGFCSNLLLFLNEPRVVIYEQSTNNKRRERKGLIPIPSQLRTKLHIDLEDYIEKIYFNGMSHSKLGFSFWVRGHWRQFHSPRFVNKQGSKTWILPHIVGEGIMPPQVFEVSN